AGISGVATQPQELPSLLHAICAPLHGAGLRVIPAEPATNAHPPFPYKKWRGALTARHPGYIIRSYIMQEAANMAGKAKGVPRDTAVALRLPRELHAQLKKAAAGRSVSEEMRARLEKSLLRDWRDDAPTRRLTEAIAELARNVKPYYGDWHENP